MNNRETNSRIIGRLLTIIIESFSTGDCSEIRHAVSRNDDKQHHCGVRGPNIDSQVHEAV